MKHLKETLIEICNRDLNKSVLLHDKGIYSHEYMISLEKFNDILLQSIEKGYSSLN